MKTLLALLACLPLGGCFLSRNVNNAPLQAPAVAKLVPGTTTQSDALALLGAPNEIVQLGKRSAWRYSHSVQKRAGLALLVVGLLNTDYQEDRVWLFFGENGVLEAAGATLTGDSAVYEMPWSDTHEVD